MRILRALGGKRRQLDALPVMRRHVPHEDLVDHRITAEPAQSDISACQQGTASERDEIAADTLARATMKWRGASLSP